jgi:TRAP-type C4-dicarboxylate transport system permease large subunit
MGAAKALAQFIGAASADPLLVMALIAVALLVLGTILDPVTLFVVFVPILVPTAAMVGIDLVHLGIVAVLATMIGLVTPPVGFLIYLTAAQAEVSSAAVVRELKPFILALLALLAIVVASPGLVLWLPRLLLGSR